MSQKVVIREERCKGCGLCVDACPKNILELAARVNDKGYHPAQCKDQEACISCASCGRTCPDLCIEIYK
ncbi:4Fe-4S binding protein [Desulfovibrio sp. OttesenSCG-928-C14]|nr:4Fe-4S binding protein [Desulfovibrio sp. OttesenSCG-928-C14]